MDYRACFSCQLLFEVTGVGEATCPQCGRVLEPHQPSQIFSVNESSAMREMPADDSMDERTRMVSRLDPELLAGIPDPEEVKTSRSTPIAEPQTTRAAPSGFPAREKSEGETRARDYRPAQQMPETQERRVPLGRAVRDAVDAVGPQSTPTGQTDEHRRPARSYGRGEARSAFREHPEQGVGTPNVSYRAASGVPSDIMPTENEGGVTKVSDGRSRRQEEPQGGATREFDQKGGVTAKLDEGRDGSTRVDDRDAHGGRRSIHRRKTVGEQRQAAVPVEIPVPVPAADESMDRTRVLDVRGDFAEKTELLGRGEIDAVLGAGRRQVGGVPVSEDDEDLRTRVVRRSDEFDALISGEDSQANLRTEAISVPVPRAMPKALSKPVPFVPPVPQAVPARPAGPSPDPRPAPDPRPRRAAPDPSPASAKSAGAGPSPLPRRSVGPSPTPRAVAKPEAEEQVPSASESRQASPSNRRSAHADYFEAGIDDDVDLTDALDAIVGDQLIQNLEAKRSTISRQAHRRRRARAQWLLVVLPVVAIAALLLILLPSGEDTSPPEVDAAVVDTVDPTKSLVVLVERAGLQLPRIRGTESLDERAPYVLASTETLQASFGSVVGLASTEVPSHLLDGDANAQWIKPLKAAIQRDATGERDLFVLALDGASTAGTVAQFGRSALQAGYERLALTFKRQEVGGGLGTMTLRLGKGKLPSAGGALIRVGKLGVHARIESRDGRRLSEKLPEVSNGEDGNLDLESIDAQMERLSRAHPLVRVGVIFVNRDLPLEALAMVMQRVTLGPEKERFTSLRLVVR